MWLELYIKPSIKRLYSNVTFTWQ